MVSIFMLKDTIGGAVAHLQPLSAWLRRYVARSDPGQPWARSPGAYALLVGVHHPDD
jgi:hypothetical protein